MSAYRPPAGGAAAVAAEVAGETEQLQPMGIPGAGGVTLTKVGKPKLTEGEKKAAGFANRIAESNEIMAELEKDATEITRYVAPYTPNWAKPEDWQRLEQAQREFVNAILRQESGAVISDAEFANAAQQYFPQPGDTRQVVAQKRRSREIALRNMKQSAGRAEVDEPDTDGGTTDFGTLSDDAFLDALTEENAEEWLREAERRGL